MNGKIIGIIGGVITIAVVVFFLFNGVTTEIQQREALRDIQISLYDIDLNDIGLSGISLRLVLDMYNPNDVTATLDSADFDVWINEKYVGRGFIPDRVDIPSQTVRKTSADFDASFSGSLKSGISILLEKQIRWKISGMAHYDTLLGTLDIPFTFTETSGLGNSNNNYEIKSNIYSSPINEYDSSEPNLALENNPEYDFEKLSTLLIVTSELGVSDDYGKIHANGVDANGRHNVYCITARLFDSNGLPMTDTPVTQISKSYKLEDGNANYTPEVYSNIFYTDYNGYAVNTCHQITSEDYWTIYNYQLHFKFEGNNHYLPSNYEYVEFNKWNKYHN